MLKSLAFHGDVDQPSHEGPVHDRAMFVRDALLIAAFNHYVADHISETDIRTREIQYNELLLFDTLDFDNDPIDSITLKQ